MNFIKLLIISFGLISCSKSKIPQQIEVVDIQIKNKNKLGWYFKDSCTISISSKTDTIITKAGIKCRGGQSSRYQKKSYSIELCKKVGLAGLPKEDDWILNANFIDKTFMRHKISYDLFKEMNPQNIASSCSFANIKYNNKYRGLYVVMQKMNGKTLGLNKSDTTAVIFKDPPVFIIHKITKEDSLNYYEQKTPKKEKLAKTFILDNFKDFITTSTPEEFNNRISTWIDIDNVVDWHLMLLFSNNGDGIVKNFYLYKQDSITPFKIAIWDYDHSFGRDGDNELNMLERVLNCDTSILLKRLKYNPGSIYPEKLKSKWHYLRKNNIFSQDNFNKHILRNDEIIKNHLEENFKKWPLNHRWYYDDNDYKQELEVMRKFVKIRIQQLDERFEYNGN